MQLGNMLPEILVSFLAIFEKELRENKCFFPGLTAYALSALIREDNGNRKKCMRIIAYLCDLTLRLFCCFSLFRPFFHTKAA